MKSHNEQDTLYSDLQMLLKFKINDKDIEAGIQKIDDVWFEVVTVDKDIQEILNISEKFRSIVDCYVYVLRFIKGRYANFMFMSEKESLNAWLQILDHECTPIQSINLIEKKAVNIYQDMIELKKLSDQYQEYFKKKIHDFVSSKFKEVLEAEKPFKMSVELTRNELDRFVIYFDSTQERSSSSVGFVVDGDTFKIVVIDNDFITSKILHDIGDAVVSFINKDLYEN